MIVFPSGPAARDAAEFVGRCVVLGLDFVSLEGDVLPGEVAAGVSGLKAIILDTDSEAANGAALEVYRRAGARVYVFDAGIDPTVPNARCGWRNAHALDMIVIDAGLTMQHPRRFDRMARRDDQEVFETLGRRMLEATETRWYDATRYQWSGLIDGYELTGDAAYLDHARGLMDEALKVENDLSNCDTIAPVLPMMRMHEHTGDRRLVDISVDWADRYLRDTQRYRGCLVNFPWLAHHARSEIIWQVCPSLAYLAKVSGEARFLDAAWDQYEHLHAALHDTDTGLWHHGVGDAHHSSDFWARGCAFVLYGLILLHEQMAERGALRSEIERMCAELIEHQHETGFWFTVIDDATTEYESSGTAWMCAALYRAMRRGAIDSSYEAPAEAAWRAVKSRVWRGHYPGHNTATTVSVDPSYYRKRMLSPTGWTHFAFRAACERGRHR